VDSVVKDYFGFSARVPPEMNRMCRQNECQMNESVRRASEECIGNVYFDMRHDAFQQSKRSTTRARKNAHIPFTQEWVKPTNGNVLKSVQVPLEHTSRETIGFMELWDYERLRKQTTRLQNCDD
jgi:hypothetical protein